MRHRSPISLIQSLFYFAARLLGDVSAASTGPGAMSRRLARRAAGEVTGRLLGRLFR